MGYSNFSNFNKISSSRYAVSFAIGDYLHVMERYDQNWWIGRKVQMGCDIGFIPSPAKLETLRIQLAQNKTAKIYANKQSSSANLAKFLPKKTGDKQSSGTLNAANSAGSDLEGEDMADEAAAGQPMAVDEPPLPGSSLVEQEQKQKRGLLGKKIVEQIPPYDVVPSMRPVVVIGKPRPSKAKQGHVSQPLQNENSSALLIIHLQVPR